MCLAVLEYHVVSYKICFQAPIIYKPNAILCITIMYKAGATQAHKMCPL
jgi:hypothetical protein